MLFRVLLAAVVSAVLIFVWGFLFWGVLGVGQKFLAPLPAELDLLAVLRGSQAESGMYIYPMPLEMGNPEAEAEFRKKHEEGPLLQLAYQREGARPMAPAMFAQGLALNFAVALLAAALVALIAPSLPNFGRRFGFVVLLSLIVAIWNNVGDLVWWFHSPQYCLGNMAYTVGAGLLMGLVIAAVVRHSADSDTGKTGPQPT